MLQCSLDLKDHTVLSKELKKIKSLILLCMSLKFENLSLQQQRIQLKDKHPAIKHAENTT